MKTINVLKSLAVLGLSLAVFAACDNKEEKPDNKEEGGNKTNVEEVDFVASPLGQTGKDVLVWTLVTPNEDDTWRIEADEDYDWIEVSPMKGLGETDVTITVQSNPSPKDRGASFLVYLNKDEDPTFELFVSQNKAEISVNAGDLQFLQDIIDGHMLGDDTPEVDNWYTFEGAGFPGISMERSAVDNKIYITKFDKTPFTAFPRTVDLPELKFITCRDAFTGNGNVVFPTSWKTPKLQDMCFAGCGITGYYPADFASESKSLAQVFMDGNDMYGAWPHEWACTNTLEVFITTNTGNHGFNAEGMPEHYNETSKDHGYLVPAQLDVIFNEDRSYQGDKTQMKLGGACAGNYLGFEEGWGQARYERFDPNAVAGDKTTWSDYRLLCGNQTLDDDPAKCLDHWQKYFSNMGYIDDPANGLLYCQCIPAVLLPWDQAAADAYTAKVEEERGL